jgi:signal recognition particle GTPase
MSNQDTSKPTGGGVATQAGTIFQNRVAAWFCVRILAEQEAAPVWELGEDVTLEYIRCETEQPVDDILIGTSKGGHAFIQVKHTVNLATTPDSPLAASLTQFIKQYLSYTTTANRQHPWERPLDPLVDRLVLVTSSRSSASVREKLPALLTRHRNLLANQSVAEAATNNDERKVLSALRSLLQHLWFEVTGKPVDEKDERQLLSLIWIQTLDVDAGERDEREAKNILRSNVVENTTQADLAWNRLVIVCEEYARLRSGADRSRLQQQLLTPEIRINAPRSYRLDIQKLKQHSVTTLQALSDLSTIRVGERIVKVDRPSSAALRNVAEQQSIVVVGDPGAGKSGVLHDLVGAFISEYRDVVFLAVDRLEARSLGGLRIELGLEREFVQILDNWPGNEPAFLVIDALDAARSEASAQTFYDLLTGVLRVPSRWRVVASIRKFDLRHNVKLHNLFAGTPPTQFQSREFYNLSHLNVQLLDVEEWKQIAQQSQELANLILQASASLGELLLVPFNVRLAGELLGGGVSVESLTPIETQIGLLDRYWLERVIRQDREGDAREALLIRAVEAMVRTRSLRVNRREIAYEPALSRSLDDILSSHILSEWEPTPDAPTDRNVLTFAHHMLFDYGVARLLLRGTTRSFSARLEEDPEVVMAIRPSIVMHFEHEWLRDEDLFWDAVFRVIRSEGIPEIGKLIGPTVAVDLAKDIAGFAPLVGGLSNTDVRIRETAEKTLRHVAGALLVAATDSKEKLVGPAAPPWAELLDQCTSDARASTVYALRPVLLTMCDHPQLLTEQQRHFAGRFARRLLHFGLTQQPRDSWLVISGIEAVCRTFESDPESSAGLLRRCLEPDHVVQFGHEELFRIGNELERLIPLDPALIEDVYRAAFTLSDQSDEKTAVMPSRIFGMTSTRKQDYGLARYSLVEKYKEFLESAPFHATRALIAALNTYVEERDGTGPARSARPEERFDFDGREAFIRADHSEIWDEGIVHQDDDVVKMLDIFQSYLERISTDDEASGQRRQILNLIAAENRAAALWRRLLTVGSKAPQSIGLEVRSLAWAQPILLNFDTTRVLGDYLLTVFNQLVPQDRERIERAILSIPDWVNDASWGEPDYVRNRLLGCLAPESIVTEEAKILLAELQAEQKVPPNEPFFKSGGVYSRAYTDEDYLKDQGVAVGEEQNRRISTLSEPLKEFGSKHLNSAPTAVEIEQVLSSLRSLHEALQTAEADGVHERQRDLAWGYLAAACRAAAEFKEISCESNAEKFIKAVLLEAAAYPSPVHHPEYDKSFDSHPSWGSPAARVDAAHGVIRLGRHATCADAALLEKIGGLATDDVPAVRYQVVINLSCLYYTAPELMWELLDQVSRQDESRGVLQAMLVGPLNSIGAYQPDRVTSCVLSIFERVRDGEGAAEVRRRCASIFAGLYLWQNQPDCGEMVSRIVEDPASYSTEANQIVFDIRNWLNIGPIEPPNPQQDAVRTGSFALLERMLGSVRDSLRTLSEKTAATPVQSLGDEDQERAKKLAGIAEQICMHVYFFSGAYKNSGSEQAEQIPLGAPERTRFLRESRRILELLSDFGYPRLTHYLLQMLEYLVAFDPEEVFLLVGRVVRSGRQGGYQYEPMAADLVVRLVERFIAEFRHILQENEECRGTLIEILDTFVEAGWPSARRLTYRMEDVFR